MDTTLIRWKLREVMERHKIKAKDLADAMDISPNALSNLRHSDMPRIDGGRLNGLLINLNKMRKTSELITPSDLIEFSLSLNESKEFQ